MNSITRFLGTLLLCVVPGFSDCSAQENPNTNAKPGSQASSENGDPFQQIGKVATKQIQESSGLAASFHRRDAFWTIDDSGHPAQVFCLNQNGELLATVVFQEGENRDWESLTRCSKDGKHYLVVADVGDNLARRSQCQLYFFPEPEFELDDKSKTLKVSPIVVTFSYSDGARDCEAVAIDPQTNDIWLFEKMMQLNLRRKPNAYRIAAEQWVQVFDVTSGANPSSAKDKSNSENAKQGLTAQRVASLNHPFVTGGEFSPDGNQLIMRTYTYAVHFTKAADENWLSKFPDLKPTLIALPVQKQGEAIAFFPDDNSLLISSEGLRQPLWLIDVKASLMQAKK